MPASVVGTTARIFSSACAHIKSISNLENKTRAIDTSPAFMPEFGKVVNGGVAIELIGQRVGQGDGLGSQLVVPVMLVLVELMVRHTF